MIFLQIYYFILLGRIILSFFQTALYGNQALAGIFRLFYGLTEPLLAPLRRVVPMVRLGMGYLDLSPIILLIILRILQQLITGYL